jgi:hypothetical protein
MIDQLPTPESLRELFLRSLSPQASTSSWDWCCRHLHLRTGRFDSGRAGLMRHWHDIASARIAGTPLPHDPMAHLCEQLWLIAAGQVAKTTLGLSLLAWVLAEHPREIAWYGTRGKDLARLRRRAILPLIDLSPPLADLLPASIEARDRALGADLLQLGASLLYLLVGNLIDDLRALPLPLIIMDEFDQLADDLEGQGDPIDQAALRQRTMPHERLLIGGTTPTGVARHGWRRLCSGSDERPLALCPACQGASILDDRLIMSGGDHPLADYPAAVILRERLARWCCPWCGCLHDAQTVRAMVRELEAAGGRWQAGTWRQTDEQPSGLWTPTPGALDSDGRLREIIPPDTVIRSGWASSLYARDETLDTFAAKMVAKLHHGTASEKKTWTNTEATRPYLHAFAPTSTDDIIAAACRSYAHGSCPGADVEWLVLTWDQQGNDARKYWYAGTLRAWAPGGESWLVWAGRARSDRERDEIEERLFPVGGAMRAPDLVGMDVANPNYRAAGYVWASEDPRRRICLRGDVRLQPGETWREVPPPDPRKTSRTSRPAEVHEWRIHPHHWRTELEEHMQGRAHPWHLPGDPPDYYLRSLNSEEQTTATRRVAGGGHEEVVIWAPRVTQATDESVAVRKDTHWADGEKMQLAIADIFGWVAAPADEAGAADRPAATHQPANPDDRRPDPDTPAGWADLARITDGAW